MRLPLIPIIVATVLLAGGYYLFTSSIHTVRTLDVPHISRLTDIDGVETEVDATPDGNRLAVTASGELWVVNVSTGTPVKVGRTDGPKSFPSWLPDGKRISFTRGTDTFVADSSNGNEELFRAGATSLAWSSAAHQQIVYVSDRALWVAAADGTGEKKLVEPEAVADVEFHSPRFSPDAQQIAFIKSQLGLRGEIWLVQASDGFARPLVVDRTAENPVAVAWINGGRDIAYLTNRAGAYSIWYIDLAASTINPLTHPLITLPLTSRIGMTAAGDRLFLPRHLVDSGIVLSDGTTVVNTAEKIEFQPSISPDGRLVAYTAAAENKFEIWTVGLNGDDPTFRTLGREPRFSANGFQIVYTYRDLNGNDDIWKLDIRNGSAERVTDADEIDISPDWSPDGQSITFASARGGAVSIWTIPAVGGKRLRVNDAGFGPRFSPDSKSLLFWNQGLFWMIDRLGGAAVQAGTAPGAPAAGVWSKLNRGPKFFSEPPDGKPVWPEFDMLPDGRFITAPIDIHETAIWAIDLTYKEN